MIRLIATILLAVVLVGCSRAPTEFVQPAPKPKPAAPLTPVGPGTVKGRTLDFDTKRPISGVTVGLRRDGDGRVIALTNTNNRGAFEFNGLAAANYFLDFDVRSFAPIHGLPISVAAERDSIVDTLMKILPGALGGTVTDIQGRPLAGASVSITETSTGRVVALETGADGKYSATDLKAGAYSLDFSLEGYIPQNGQIVQVRAGETANFDARLVRNIGSLGGKVTDYDDGNALGGASVTLHSGSSSGPVVATTVTDAQGNYRFEELVPGDYYADFALAGYIPQNGEYVNVRFDRSSSLNAQLRTTLGKLRGQVFDATNGRGVEGVEVTLKDANGVVVARTQTDQNGRYSFPGLQAGNYRVDFEKSGWVAALDVPTQIFEHETTELDQVMTKELDPNQWRIVLTWTGPKTAAVADVDSYLEQPNGLRIYYSNQDTGHGANLDKDDTDWSGPETTTITNIRSGRYTYYVANYNVPCDRDALGNSEVVVKVYKGSSLLKTYQVPRGRGTKYEVLRIDGGQLIDRERYNESLWAEPTHPGCTNSTRKGS